MSGRLLSYEFEWCPYCGRHLESQATLPIMAESRPHMQCVRCDRCLTCEEKAAKGWKRDRH